MATSPERQRVLHAVGLHGLDVRGAVTGVGEESGLLTGERMRTVPGGVNGHGEKAHGDALTGGHQHVHLALGRVGVDAQRLVDQVVGRVSHGGDDHGHPCCHFFLVSTTRLATRLIDSVSATDEPPYFCTMRATAVLSSHGMHLRQYYASGTIIGISALPRTRAPPCGQERPRCGRRYPSDDSRRRRRDGPTLAAAFMLRGDL